MSRTAELTLKLLDGALSDDDASELDALVAADPGAEVEHIALLELEAELRGLRTEFELTDATLALVLEAQTERTTDAVMAEIGDRTPPAWAHHSAAAERTMPGSRRRMRTVFAILVACAAAVLLAVVLNGKVENAPPDENPVPATAPRAFAKLSRKAGFVEVVSPTGDAIPTEEGGDLPAGFTLRTVGDDSLAVIDLLSDNSRFEIEPDSVVRFRDGSPENANKPQLFLAAGQLTAAIRPQPDDRPMVVGTPVAEVFAHSGLFVVSSAGPDTARVDIKRGKVELVRPAAPKRVAVGVGSAVVTAGFDKVQIEQSATVDRVPKRTLVAPGTRDAIYSPDGAEVWLANARSFTRWSESGTAEMSFYNRKSNDGIAAFARNKQYLAAFRGGPDDRVLIRTLPDGGEHAAVNFRPNETRFWTVAPDASWFVLVEPKANKRVRVLDGATGNDRFHRDFEEAIGCVAASPDARVLAVGLNDLGRGANNKVVLVDAATGDRLSALPTQKKSLTAMTYSSDGQYLAVGFNGVIQLWDVRSRELIRSITGFERALTCLAFAPDGKRLAAGTQDGHVWLWHTDTGAQTQLIETGGRLVRSIAFHPNGKQFVTVVNGAPVAVWDVNEAMSAAILQ